MGCTSSSPVAPLSNTPAGAISPTLPRPSPSAPPSAPPAEGAASQLPGGKSELSAAIAGAVIDVNDFFDGASTVLETVSAAPDAISNFASALQDNAGDLRDAMTAIIGAAADITQAAACMTPAVVIVAPALAAVRALAKQLAQLRENAELAESLKAELAFADTLLLHAGRSDLLAKDHTPLLNVICGAANDAAALVLRISKRSKFMSFVAAGSDGTKLRGTLSQLHDRFAALGVAAAVAGAAGVSEVPAAVVEKLRLALRDDAGAAGGPTRRDTRAAAPGSPAVHSPSASPESVQSAEISESRLAVDWGAPSLLGAGTANSVFAGVLFGADAVAIDEAGSGIAVAVRLLQATSAAGDKAGNVAAVRRFLRDAKLQMRLSSASGCVASFGVCILGGGRVALVQERMASSLRDILRARALSSRVALRVTLAICDAVSGLHASYPYMLHGDLRPANVMLTAEGEPRLANVGVAEDSSSGPDGSDVASPDSVGYSAPERLSTASRDGRPSRAADVWAAAALVVAVVTRVPPYSHLLPPAELSQLREHLTRPPGSEGPGATPPPPTDTIRAAVNRCEPPYSSSLLADILTPLLPSARAAPSEATASPPPLAAVLSRCWLSEPADRPDAAELADALHAALVAAGGDPRAAPVVPVPQSAIDAVKSAIAEARTAVPSTARRLAQDALQASSGSAHAGGDARTPSSSGGAEVVTSSHKPTLSSSPAADPALKVVAVQWGGHSYFFRGELYWRIHASGTRMDGGYPLSIVGYWGVPGPVDAAIEWNGRTYLFSGELYWRLNTAGNGPDRGYPISIERGWGVPGPIDAALVWSGRVYLFRGSHYWRLNEAGDAADRGYPMPIEREWGVPGPIDSTMLWEGGCYIFRGDAYWKLNEAGNAPESGPLSIADDWGLPKAPRTSMVPVRSTQSNKIVTAQWGGFTYFFRGQRYYQLNDAGNGMVGESLDVYDNWGVQGPIDAALEWNERTYLFKGGFYWRINNSGWGPDDGYPLSIKEQWGVPGPIDAALVWSGRVYLFRGGKYWRLNDACDAPDAGYPMPIEREWGVPGPIDAAMIWEGDCYFFRGDDYWKLNAAGNAPESGPSPISDDWGLPKPARSK